jgi:hypothetical protein
MPASDTTPRSSPLIHLGAFAAYLLLAIVLTWPLSANLRTAVPNDLVDPLLNAWLLWWNATTLPYTTAWWNAPAFYPGEWILTFSEHMLGVSPLSTPLYWITGSAQITYNVTFLLTFPLAAIASYLLCLELTGRRDAAFLGGLIYGFTPYRVAQMAHVQVMASYFMPLALLGLHRYIRRRSPRWLVLFGTAWLLQALSNGYYLAYFSILVALWVAWFVPWRAWRTWLPIGATVAAAMVPLLPVVLAYRAAHDLYGIRRSIDEIRTFSADLTSLLHTSPHLAFWTWLNVYRSPEGELYTGLGVLLIIGLGLWSARRVWAAVPVAPRRARLLLMAGVVVFTGISVSAVVSPWSFSLFGLGISSNRPDKPLTLAIVCAIALLGLARPVRYGLRTRSALAFYVLAAAITWLLALGPSPTFMGEPVMYEAPYAWLLRLPGFDALRVPARFAMIVMLCLSVAAALAFRHLSGALRTDSSRVALTAALTVVVMADAWIGRMPLSDAPPVWDIAPDEVAGAVLVLPLSDSEADVRAMYQGMGHGKPVVNGYSGAFPPWYVPLQYGLDAHDPRVLDDLSQLGVTQIVVSDFFDREDVWHAFALTRATLVREGADGTYRLFDLPAAPPWPAEPVFTTTVPPASITTHVKPELLPRLQDGDLLTRWESGPQVGTEALLIDLGTPRQVSAVDMRLGPFGADFPRELVVEVSDDALAWTEVWRGSTARMAFRAGVTQVGRTPLVFDIGDRTTRYIRLRQVGRDDTYYWSIAELEIRGGRR